jgi:site-specific DNA recombinase
LFDEHGCAFNSLSESIDTETASGRMFLKIIGIFAEFERENIIERSKLGFERKVKEGYSLSNRVPSYGYERKDGEKIQQINETEAQIVREIFSMYLYKHLPLSEIAKVLNLRKIPTKEKAVWYPRTIKDVLTNCNYIGNVRYATKDKKKNFETMGRHEPIISREMYEETQLLISKMTKKNYTKRPKEEQYFVGILVCAKCGGHITTHGAYRKEKNVFWGAYRCCNVYGKKCNAMNMSHKNVEKAFSEYIKNINNFSVLNKLDLDKKTEREKDQLKQTYQKQYESLDKKEKETLTSYINNQIELENYVDIKNSLNSEKQKILTMFEQLENQDEHMTVELQKADIINNLRNNWDLLTPAEKRQFLVNFVDTITIINEPKTRRSGTVKILDVVFCEQKPVKKVNFAG